MAINMTGTELHDQACCGGATHWLPTDDAVDLAGRIGALADATRLQVLSIIANSPAGEVCACDFVGPLDKSQPTISHHLRVLSEAGLVAGERRGRWIWYRVADGAVAELCAALRDLIDAEAVVTTVPTEQSETADVGESAQVN